MFGERPLCVAIRPQLLTRRRYEQAVNAAEGVFSALTALEKAVLKDADLRAELGLEPEEERLAMADPGFRSSSPSVRLDSFFADEVRFVEYNAESPAGMAYSDNLAAIFADLPAMKAFRKQFRGAFLPTRRRQLLSDQSSSRRLASGGPGGRVLRRRSGHAAGRRLTHESRPSPSVVRPTLTSDLGHS